MLNESFRDLNPNSNVIFELIELAICMVRGTESGARIYNTKIRRNRAAFPNSIKSRKVKGKDDKNLFSVQKH